MAVNFGGAVAVNLGDAYSEPGQVVVVVCSSFPACTLDYELAKLCSPLRKVLFMGLDGIFGVLWHSGGL